MADPQQRPGCLRRMAALHRRINGAPGTGLPALKARLAHNIGRAAREGVRGRLLDGLAAMPEGDRLCHGDFHP